MPYYGRGDYYRGDYYRGDPGLLGILKGVGKGLLGAASLIPGPVGAAASAVRGVLTRSPGTAVARVPNLGAPNFTMEVGVNGPQVIGPSGRLAISGGSPQGLMVQGTAAGAGACELKGYHLNKGGYYRRMPGGGVTYIEARSACVKNRSMNPTNGRALRRALRRAMAFKRIAIKTLRLVDPSRKAKKFAGFKTRTRSKK